MDIDQYRECIFETTVLHLPDEWAVAVDRVYEGEYVDSAGNMHVGPLAQILVSHGDHHEEKIVHTGAIFEADKRYQVVNIEEGPYSGKPGGTSSFIELSEVS